MNLCISILEFKDWGVSRDWTYNNNLCISILEFKGLLDGVGRKAE